MDSRQYFPDPEERPWVFDASCRDADPEMFFPATEGEAAHAVLICRGCSVQPECLDWAIEMRMTYGIWGGTTERERRRLWRRSA